MIFWIMIYVRLGLLSWLINCYTINTDKKSKLSNHSREQPEGSLFNSYYTDV